MILHVLAEANRCFECKKPMCQLNGCPIHTPIPQMIHMLKEGKLREAGDMLFANNPLSVVCSLVCNHQMQCEGSCIQGKKGSPIHISSIENYISDTCLDQLKLDIPKWNGKRMAIIGAGPAGITVAIEMAKKGYKVTVFDAKDKIGGVLQYGIPEFRLPKSVLKRYSKLLRSMGISVRPNTTIGGALEIKDLFRDGYKAIFIGTGVWRPKKLGIKGESLGNVHFAIDFLANPAAYNLGDNVAIIGAGNTAMDVARTLLRKGTRHVTLIARRNKIDASEEEAAYARLDGAEFLYARSPIEITDEGPILDENMMDDEGNITGSKGAPELFKADSTIIAISQGPKSKLVDTTRNLQASKSGLLLTNDRGETTCPGVFAAGDVVLGAKTVVQAVSYSKSAAQAIDAYIQGLPDDYVHPLLV